MMIKKTIFAALAALLTCTTLAADVTRSIELTADKTGAVFAVPNGFSFTRAYACDAQGSAVAVTVGDPTVMNHVVLLPVAVSGEKVNDEGVKVTVVFADDGEIFTGRPAKVMREAIKEKVANPEDVPTTQYVAPAPARKLKLAVVPQTLDDEPEAQTVDGADVLILSPHDNVELWNQYATFRKSTAAGADLEFLVKDLNEVYRDYPFNASNTDGAPRNAAESIHKYLRESCDKLGVSYVILGGSWINAQHLDASNQWTDNDGNVIYLQTNVPMSLANCVPGIIANPRQNEEDPSDMFYACLNLLDGQTYPWCVGSSTKYFDGASDSKNLGKCDSGVDVIVSRMPLKPTKIGEKIYTAAELMTAFIAKIERAESSDFSGMGRLGSLWGAVGSTPDVNGSLPTEYEFYDDADNMFDADRITRKFNDAEVAQRAMIKDHVAKYYPVRAVDTLSEQLWTKGFETYNDAIAAYFASDRDYAGIDSHGWAGGSEALSCGNFDTATGITLLNDVSVPCQTGWQDRTGAGKDYNSELTGKTVAVPCAGEAAVQGPTGGAIASLNNSRTGLTGPLGSNSLSYLLYHESAKAFLHQGKDAGNSWLSAHLAFVGSEFDPSSPVAKELGGGGAHTLEEHTLFGDPLIKSQVNRADGVLVVNTSVSGVNAYINATVNGDLTLSGEGRIKVLQTLSVSGATFTVEDGVEGGIGQKVVFTGEKGRIVVNTSKRFYLGGVENCSEIVVNGSNVIIDCDRLMNVEKITFNMAAGVSNTLRGIKKNALAGVNIESTGGTLVFETSDVLGGTSVKLEGTTIVLGADPQSGSLVASGEPLRGTFSGSGIIKYKHGTELMKDWTITGSIQTVDDGSEIEPGLIYTGLVGQNPTGWFSGWAGEGFNANHAVLGPKGFVNYVEDGKHPHVNLAAKKGFTLSLYADLSKVDASKDVVMLSLGSSNDNQNGQLLLMSDHGNIKLVVTGTNGGSAATKYENLFTVTPGYHLYTIERVVATKLLKFYVDGVETVNDTNAFSLGSGLQLGSQFGGLKLGREKALGMAVAGLIGYDAVLTAEELRDHVADYPASGSPIAVAESVDLSAGNDVQAELVAATFAENTYLGANNGAMTIPANTTVSVSGVKLLNASQGGNVASLTVNGTLNVTGESTANGPYRDFANGVNAGIMLGHWGGTSTLTINEDGCVNAPNGDLLIGYTASGVVDVNGGVLTVKGLTNYSAPNDILNNNGSVIVQNGGTLEVASWPIRGTSQLGTMPITFNNGTLRGTTDWTCPRPLTVSGPMTIDAAGHNLIFSGAITGADNISVVDSSEGKTGSVIFVGSLQDYTGTITIASSVAKFGVRREYVGSSKIFFATRPATLIVALSADQLQEAYTASPYAVYMNAGSTVVFTDYDGYVYQETKGTTSFSAWRPKTYTYDGIDWSYIFLPYERGVWEPLINWRTIWTNGTEENAARLFTSGPAPQLVNSNRWYPIILNGAEFQSDDDLVDGLHFVRATRLEGWNPRIGVYNGVHLYIDEFYKFQHGNEYDNGPEADKWLRVDDKSRVTIAKVGTGNSSGTMKFYVGGENALVFKTNVAGNASEYYFSEGGSVKFESGVKAGTHAVKEVHATLGDATGAYYNLKGVKVADFNNKGSTARFTSENGALKLAGYDGTTRYLANSLAVLSDAKSSGLGGFTLMQGDAGVYAMYAERSATSPTEITINGNQTNLDLANLPYDSITKIKIAGAWGYFKGEDHTISTQVEFNDTAAGLPAFRWENGYGAKYVAFANASGHGTIFINGGTPTSQAMFFEGGDFDGSIILTNGNNRVSFGTPTMVQQAQASRIEVKSGATANLKDGGIWAASELAIDGTLVCKGRADVICFGGITGVDHIEIPDGYEKSVMTIGGNVARVWVLPQGEVPQAEGQLNFQFGAVTIPSFNMGENLLKVTSGTVTLEEDAVVIAPRLEVDDEASFVAAAKVGDTYYGSFAKAAEAANNGEKTITLLSNVSDFELAAGKSLTITKNGHTISFAEGLTVEETENADGSISYLSTSTRYTIVYHVKDTDGSDCDVSDLIPTSFATEHLPIDLPLPTAADKVFHGWYAAYKNGEYSDGPQKCIERMARDNELHLYGYWRAAVATVKGISYDNWDDAFKAQNSTGYSIVALDRSRLPAGYFVNDSGYLVKIQATVLVGYPQVQTAFSSFAEARAFAKGKEGAYISLSADATSRLELGNDETVLVALNNFALEVEAVDPENYNVHASNDDAPWITTYRAVHRDVILTLPTMPEGVTATVSTNGIAIAANEAGNYIVHYNAAVTITYAVEGAFTLSKARDMIPADGDKNADDFTAPVKTAAVAQRGNTYYPSVQSALSAANGSKTVTVLQMPSETAITIPNGITVHNPNKGWTSNTALFSSITIEGTATFTGYAIGITTGDARTLTLNDGAELTVNLSKQEGDNDWDANFILSGTTIAGSGTIKVAGGRLLIVNASSLANDSNVSFVLEEDAQIEDGSLIITTAAISTPDDANKVVKSGYVYSVAAKEYYTVSLSEHEHATVSALPESVREDSAAISFTVTPDDDYRLVSVKAKGVALTSVDGCYTYKVSANTTITVETTIKTFTVTAPTGTGLTVSATSVTADIGETITITYTLAEGYVLKSGDLVQTFSYSEETQTAILPTVVRAQAKIGDKLYATVSAALSAAQSGETVTVVSTPAAEAIAIPTGVTLDIGSHGWNDYSCVPQGGYEIIAEDGAVLRGVVYNAHYPTIKSLTLNGDCSFGTEASNLSGVFGLGTGERGASSITLNEHTLHVWGSDNVNFFFETTTVTDAGTINIHKGRFMTHCTSLDASKAKLVFSGNSTPVLEAGATVGELELTTSGTLTVSSNQTLTIANQDTKKYLPAAEMHKISLGSGATFDYGWQPGKVISINFDSGRGEMTGDTVDMTFAGKVPRSSWVNTAGGNGTNVAVGQYWDSDANAAQTISGMTIGYSSLGTYGPKVTATLPFMKGYLDLANYANQSVTLDLAGIPFKKCDLIIYFQTDNGNGFRPVEITHNYGATTTTYGYDAAKNIVTTGYSDPWGGGNQVDISYAQNVMRIDGLVGSVLHVVTLPSATYRTSVAAIQIVENTEGVVTYRRNPAATSNDWMVEDGWLLPDGTPTTWANPDLASGQIYTAEIDADRVSEIKLTSQVTASSVIVTSTASTPEKEFKFLTDEDLGEVATPKDNPKSILNAPVDATGFKGALYLQSRISGAISMGTNMHITFVAMDEGVETTAYPYTFVGNLSTITKIGPGTFRVPQSMAGVPYNIEAGYILYDYEGDETVQLGKVTGNGTAILKSSNLQLAADNTAALDWQSDYLKVTGNLFANNAGKTLNIPAEKTVEVIDNSNQTNARDGVYTGTGTLKFSGTAYHILNSSSLPATTLKVEIEVNNGIIFPYVSSETIFELGTIAGSKGFRSDYSGDDGDTSRNLRVTQRANTEWSGTFMQSTTHDRFGTFYVAGAEGAAEKTLTISGNHSGATNALAVESSGSVKLTGTWKGNVTVDGEFGGTGTIQAGYVLLRDVATLNVDFGAPTLSGVTELTIGTITVKGANINIGTTLMSGVPEGVILPRAVTINNHPGYTLVVDSGALKVGDIAQLQVTIPQVAGTTASVEGYDIINGVVTVPYGESITITYAANEGFEVNGTTSLTISNITANQSPAAPDFTATVKPNQMLYCFHLDGNTDNAGVMGTSGVELSGTPTIEATGALNSSHAFKANSGSVVITTADCGLTCEAGFTLSFWINPNGLGSWQDACGFQIGDMIYKFEKNGGNQFAMYSMSESDPHTVNDTKTINFTENTWLHIALVPTDDGTGLNIFGDGNLLMRYSPGENKNLWGTAEGATSILKKFVIGVKGVGSYSGTTWSGVDGRTSNALVDEVAIYNAALSANQIAWLAANKPSTDVFDVSDRATPFGSKVIGLHNSDECHFWLDGETIKSRVSEKYDQVVVTILVDLPETSSDMRILAISEGQNEGQSEVTADLWWNGSKLFLGWDGGNKKNGTNDSTCSTTAGLHLISYKLVWRDSTSTPVGVELFVDGSTTANAANDGIKWTSKKPTGTFTYQGDIKSITLDFTTPDQETGAAPVSGLSALPKFTQGGAAVTKLETISEILEMTGKSIGDAALSGTGPDKTVPADVTMGSLVETGDAETIGIEVGTSLDLPNGEVTILVDDGAGNFIALEGVDSLTAPTADPSLHDARNKLVVPINSLLNGAKSRLFKLKVSPK